MTLRGRRRAGGTGEGFAIPEGADADTQLENVIGEVLRQKGESAAPEVLAASGSSLDIPTSWGVMGVYLRDAITGVGQPVRRSSTASASRRACCGRSSTRSSTPAI